MKDPFRPADRTTLCPQCREPHGWNVEDRLGGQQCCGCGYCFTGRERAPKAVRGVKTVFAFKIADEVSSIYTNEAAAQQAAILWAHDQAEALDDTGDDGIPRPKAWSDIAAWNAYWVEFGDCGMCCSVEPWPLYETAK